MHVVSIDQVHQLCYYFAAKQLSAFPSPAEFNQYANYANIDLFNYYNDEREKMLLSIKAGQVLFTPQILSNFIVNEYPMSTILTSASVQSASFPVDYIYDVAFKTPVNGINSTIAKVDYNKLESYLNSSVDQPTTSKPIYVELSDSFSIYPTLSTPCFLTYYRMPRTVNWNYTVINGVPTYTSSGSVDFEWQVTELIRLTARILSYMGLSIRDEELEKTAMQMVNTAS